MFNRLTDGFKIDLKGKNPVTLEMEIMPKLIATSNYYLKGTGTAYSRRYKEYEITDWWRGKDPEKHYGHLLYFDWDEEEWSRFDSFMARCAGKYLREGLKEYRGDNSAEKSLDTNLGDLRDFFDETLDPLPYWTVATELIEKYEDWYRKVHAGKYMKISYTAKTIKSKLKTYCRIRGLVYDDNDGVARRHDGNVGKWIEVTNPNPSNATKGGCNYVTETPVTPVAGAAFQLQADENAVTSSEDDPLFGGFSEKTESCNGNPVTGSGSGNKAVTTQLVENEVLMKKCNYVTENYYPLHKKEEDENIYKELEKPVTSLHSQPGIRKHKLDKDGNIILED